MTGWQRSLLGVLLWVCLAMVVLAIAGIFLMENAAANNGGGEMAESFALGLLLAVILYYALLWSVGRFLLNRANASWAGYFNALFLVLVLAPIIILLRTIY